MKLPLALSVLLMGRERNSNLLDGEKVEVRKGRRRSGELSNEIGPIAQSGLGVYPSTIPNCNFPVAVTLFSALTLPIDHSSIIKSPTNQRRCFDIFQMILYSPHMLAQLHRYQVESPSKYGLECRKVTASLGL